MVVFMCYIKESIIPELQNRVTHYDVKNRVTNSKFFFFLIFELVTRCVNLSKNLI